MYSIELSRTNPESRRGETLELGLIKVDSGMNEPLVFESLTLAIEVAGVVKQEFPKALGVYVINENASDVWTA